MRNIVIPETAEAYQTDLMNRAFPEQMITENDFYRRLIGWVIDEHTPLLYEQDHPDEYTNLSINFNWMLLRDYSRTKLGSPDTIATMYGIHEATHMTRRLPKRLDEVTAAEYADDFTFSEFRASNESEILIHYRIPELRQMILQGTRIAFDIMKERGIEQPSSALLAKLRALIVEHDEFDGIVVKDPEDLPVLDFIKRFNGNRQWALEHFEAIRPYFVDKSLPRGSGLIDSEYEPVIAAYEPNLTQERYEANVITNVRMAFGMCRLPIPFFHTFADALEAAQELEGRYALVRS